MPYTINGIGSWYYGRKNENTYEGQCEFCGVHTHLSSYDTTKFFVFVYIPVIPLGGKRVLDECPHCKKHRVMSLKDWEKFKEETMDSLYAKWIEEPNNIENTMKLLQAIAYYKSLDRLKTIAPDIRSHCSHNAEVMNQLGLMYSLFNEFEEAQAAFNTSLSVEQNRDVSENLAEALMKDLKPEEAERLVEHIIEERIMDRIYYIRLLIESYQYNGDHSSALAVIEKFETAFPELKNNKTIITYRRKSERYHDKQRSIKGSLIKDNLIKRDKKDKKHLSFILPKLIFPAIVTIVLIIYVISAFIIGLSREVYLVNGLNKPYTVEVNGKSIKLESMSRKKVKLAEGTAKFGILDMNTYRQDMTIYIKTPFWSRPLNKPLLVVNPDRTAVFLWEETQYTVDYISSNYKPNYRFYTGKSFYNLKSVNYLFEDFPETLMMQEGSKKTKTNFIQLDEDYLKSNYMYILSELEQDVAESYAKSRLHYEPDNEVNLYVYLSLCDKESGINFLRTKLAQRPVIINWHRIYQDYMQRNDPSHDLVEEYSDYLENEKDNNALYYLLSRVLEEPKEAEDLLLKSIEGSDPCPYGYYGLAYQRMSEGNYEEALRFAEEAVKALPEQMAFESVHEDAMLAQGRYDDLLQKNKLLREADPYDGNLAEREIRLHMYRGNTDSAQNAISKYVSLIEKEYKGYKEYEGSVQIWDNYLKGVIAYCSNDVTAYSMAIEGIESPQFAFENAFIKGEFDKALTIATENSFDGSYFLLLYLAQDNPEEASKCLEQAINILKNGNTTERLLADYLSGAKNWGIEEIKSITVLPEAKRIIVATLGKLNPDYQQELFAFAKKLNYDNIFPYHFIEKTVGNN